MKDQKMSYTTLLVRESLGGLTVTLNRLSENNSINAVLLNELNRVLDEIERQPCYRLLVIEGQQGLFCTGMDFTQIDQRGAPDCVSDSVRENALFMETIRRLTLTSKIIVSVIDGKAIAGGVGLVAASDWVISTERSQFSLSEALWGLLPAIVIPYLIRRVGFQQAYRMALTTMPICARKACDIGLVDELGDSADEMIRRLYLRLNRIDASTLKNIKQYFRKMWILSDQMETEAVSELNRLLCQSDILQNIRNYIEYRRLPWERRVTDPYK